MPSSSSCLISSVVYPRIGASPQIVPSTYGYVSGYTGAKSIPEQVNILCRLFPSLAVNFSNIQTVAGAAPDNTEGFFVIPHWSLVAQTYNDAVLAGLEVLGNARGREVYHYSFNKMGHRNLIRNFNTERAFRSLSGDEEEWWHKTFIVPAQFGVQYRGISPAWAKRAYRKREFGLGLFEGIIMLITHPERLKSNDDLWIEFSGDNYYPFPDEKLPIHTPFMNIINGKIGVGTSLTNMSGARYGSATWFLP